MDFSKIPNYPKPAEQTQEILNLLKKSFLTAKLSESEVQKIAGAMQPKEFKKDEIIIRYGDMGKEYYVLAKGDVKVIVYEKGAKAEDPDK
jgi:CRP-like cAMP-binding protein